MKIGVNPLSFLACLKHVALITHAVPAARVRRHLPKHLELETYHSPSKGEMTFVSIGIFLNQGFRWSVVPYPRIDFEQCTYKTYVRYRGYSGAYFFSTYLGSKISYWMQKAMADIARPGTFKIRRDYEVNQGYQDYSGLVRTDHGLVHFKLAATERVNARGPFDSARELVRFFTSRQHGFFKSSLGIQSDQIVQHPAFDPFSGRLHDGRFEFWEKLGIVEPLEATDTFSVLVQPSIDFEIFPPFPVRLLPAEEQQRGLVGYASRNLGL